MIFLLDANVLIDANRDYYFIDRFPEFWDWLIFNGQTGNIKIPMEIFDELKNGNDRLSSWSKLEETKDALALNEEVNISLVQRVLREGYAEDLNDSEAEKLGRDPFLIAYALSNNKDRCIVTTEVSKPSRQRANKAIPDVCNLLGIPWFHSYEFYRTQNFGTNWKQLV